MLLAGALSVAAFWSQAQPSMLLLPILAWAALRLDVLGAADRDGDRLRRDDDDIARPRGLQ